MKLSMSANPPISFIAKRSKVEISDSGECRNNVITRDLLAKIISAPATVARNEKVPSTIRKAR